MQQCIQLTGTNGRTLGHIYLTLLNKGEDSEIGVKDQMMSVECRSDRSKDEWMSTSSPTIPRSS